MNFKVINNRFIDLANLFINPDSRLFILYLLLSIIIVWLVYRYEYQKNKKTLSKFISYLFPKRVYRHPSFRLDVKLILFNTLVLPTGWILQGFTLKVMAVNTYDFLIYLFSTPLMRVEMNLFSKIFLGIILFIVYDFARFICHYAHHKIPFLWNFHTVHHSAEELNPLTTLRFHPLEYLLEHLSVIVFVGVIAGTFSFILGIDALISFEMVIIWFYFRVFNLFGATLRHSHIWLNWGRRLSHIFISPSQHQIHHSRNPKHFDKNFGVCFAFWDWIFGSLYIPKKKENITYGIPEFRSYNDSLTGTLKRPFVENYYQFKRKRKRKSFSKNENSV